MVPLIKENNGGSAITSEQAVKDKLPVVDKIDSKLTSVNKSDKNTTSKLPEKDMEVQSDVLTTLPVDKDSTTVTTKPANSFHAIEDKSFAEDKKITSLNSISNNAAGNDSAPLGRSKGNVQQSHHEEPFSPDGFTQFEKVLV